MAKNTYLLSVLTLSAFILSACAQMQAPTTQSVSLRNDPGIITPLPPKRDNTPLTPAPRVPQGYDSATPFLGQNSSVSINSSFGSSAGGTIMPNNSSVTIFPVDGTMGAGIPQFGQQQQGQQGYGMTSGGMMGASNNRIFFKDGSSRLGSIDKQRIENAAQQVKFGPSIVSVEGYSSRPTQAGTGTVESHVLNLKQSMNRSFAVARELMREGVPGEKVKAVSWGAARATGNNNFDRRVDINTGAAY